MAMGFKRSGDLALESRHLVGLFLLMVVIFGVVFSLGYLLGRNQGETKLYSTANRDTLRTATAGGAPGPAGKAHPTSSPPVPAPSEWDLYRSGDSKKTEALQKTAKAPAVGSKLSEPTPASGKVSSAESKASTSPPTIPRGGIVLQVAALTKETDALALAEALQKKKFPAFVLPPAADHYYRVQVGPYADEQSADLARHKLENEGFKAILKR